MLFQTLQEEAANSRASKKYPKLAMARAPRLGLCVWRGPTGAAEGQARDAPPLHGGLFPLVKSLLLGPPATNQPAPPLVSFHPNFLALATGCRGLVHVAMAMESLSDTLWDVVICGTGLQQSLLALYEAPPPFPPIRCPAHNLLI